MYNLFKMKEGSSLYNKKLLMLITCLFILLSFSACNEKGTEEVDLSPTQSSKTKEELPSETKTSNLPAVQQEIANLMQKHAELINDRDIDGVMALYSPDYPDYEFQKMSLKDYMDSNVIRVSEVRLGFIETSDKLVKVEVAQTFELKLGKNEGDLQQIMIYILEKKDDKWLIVDTQPVQTDVTATGAQNP